MGQPVVLGEKTGSLVEACYEDALRIVGNPPAQPMYSQYIPQSGVDPGPSFMNGYASVAVGVGTISPPDSVNSADYANAQMSSDYQAQLRHWHEKVQMVFQELLKERTLTRVGARQSL